MSDSPARFKDLCLDAVDHQALADWWCSAMGYRRDERPGWEPDWPVPLVDPTGAGPAIWVNLVPEPKTVKNRVHHDVTGDTGALLAMGATLVRARDDVDASDHDAGLISWDVLADPEGNEFCCFAPDEA
ncbi:hypothetical protein GCM10023328_45460 [Modestobacter marinus]|uniref:Glyoxalase-like domain-containing protein n=1 Tax=Modestobacter marinus TaxID=477641 RepID=A0A846LL81_9ACTN|nr:VOC family protein [Modestobacter marinus]NIH66075.1 hypothetical protein [Modestobacter marinus]GGL84364.1 hypothetical protein GCM10011589_46090 [Modestobacter marinus]